MSHSESADASGDVVLQGRSKTTECPTETEWGMQSDAKTMTAIEVRDDQEERPSGKFRLISNAVYGDPPPQMPRFYRCSSNGAWTLEWWLAAIWMHSPIGEWWGMLKQLLGMDWCLNSTRICWGVIGHEDVCCIPIRCHLGSREPDLRSRGFQGSSQKETEEEICIPVSKNCEAARSKSKTWFLEGSWGWGIQEHRPFITRMSSTRLIHWRDSRASWWSSRCPGNAERKSSTTPATKRIVDDEMFKLSRRDISSISSPCKRCDRCSHIWTMMIQLKQSKKHST